MMTTRSGEVIRALLVVVKLVRRVWLLEVAGAALVIAGVAVGWGTAFALLTAGGLVLLKAFDLSLAGDA
jgi:hypothetical protein